MFYLLHFCIKTLKTINKILIIIQRSNGDVFLSSSLIKYLYEYYRFPKIDLLINDDTFSISKLIPFINEIHQFSYKEKQNKQQTYNTIMDSPKKIELKKKIFVNI